MENRKTGAMKLNGESIDSKLELISPPFFKRLEYSSEYSQIIEDFKTNVSIAVYIGIVDEALSL